MRGDGDRLVGQDLEARVNAGVDDDIHPSLILERRRGAGDDRLVAEQDRIGQGVDRRAHRAVGMQFLEGAPVGLNFDLLRREDDRDARGGRQDIAEQAQRLGPADVGDGAHVPDDGALSVKIGGDHLQTAAFAILARDGAQ